MQVMMSMEEYEDLILKNERTLVEIKEKHIMEIIAIHNRLMGEIRELKAEKNNDGCKFCNSEDSYYVHGLNIDLINDKLNFSYFTCACGSFEDNQLTIKYCPMCGKKLEG